MAVAAENFKNLLKNITDTSYIQQISGNNSTTAILKDNKFLVSTIKDLLVDSTVLAIFVVVVIIIVILVFYIHPRSTSFYNKENMDTLLTENEVLKNTVSYFTALQTTCPNVYSLLQNTSIYMNTNNLQIGSSNLNNVITSYYAGDYDTALKDYFLYYNKIAAVNNTSSGNKVFDFNNISFTLTNEQYDLYETYITYSIATKTLDPGKKGENELLYDLWVNDEQVNKNIYNKLNSVHTAIQSFTSSVSTIGYNANNNNLFLFQVLSFVDLPSSNLDNTQISTDLQNAPPTSYDVVNEYSWKLFEVSSFTTDSFEKFRETVAGLTNGASISAEANTYLNLPAASRPTYLTNSRSPQFLATADFILKHPIFSRVYFSEILPKNIDRTDVPHHNGDELAWKTEVYDYVVSMYITLLSAKFQGCVVSYDNLKDVFANFLNHSENFANNCAMIKNFSNNINIAYLYLSTYQKNITKIYESQFKSKNQFFKDLWSPYFDDFLVNRIGSYFKRVFSGANLNNNWSNFQTAWKSIGSFIQSMPNELIKIVENPSATPNSNVPSQISNSNSSPQPHPAVALKKAAADVKKDVKIAATTVKKEAIVAAAATKKAATAVTKEATVAKTDVKKAANEVKKIVSNPKAAIKSLFKKKKKEKFENGDIVEGFLGLPSLGGLISGVLSIGKFFISLLQLATELAKLVGQIVKDPFGTILKIFTLLIGVVICVILSILYFVMSIPPFIFGPWAAYFFATEVVPLVLYSVTFALLLAFITIICLILTVINVITNGAIANVVLCDNAPDNWYKIGNFPTNKHERELLCMKPCGRNFAPDVTGLTCVAGDANQPAFCPQAEIFRIYNGTFDTNYIYDFNVYTSPSYAKALPKQREEMLKAFFVKRNAFLTSCSKNMKPYDYVSQGICANLDVLSQTYSASDIAKLKNLCSQAYCGSKDSYSFCGTLTNSTAQSTSDIVKKIALIVTLIIVFIVIVFLMVKQLNGNAT